MNFNKAVLLSLTMLFGLSGLRADYKVFGETISNKAINGKEETRWLGTPKACLGSLLAFVAQAEVETVATNLNGVKARIESVKLSESNTSQENIFNRIRTAALRGIENKIRSLMPSGAPVPVVTPVVPVPVVGKSSIPVPPPLPSDKPVKTQLDIDFDVFANTFWKIYAQFSTDTCEYFEAKMDKAILLESVLKDKSKLKKLNEIFDKYKKDTKDEVSKYSKYKKDKSWLSKWNDLLVRLNSQPIMKAFDNLEAKIKGTLASLSTGVETSSTERPKTAPGTGSKPKVDDVPPRSSSAPAVMTIKRAMDILELKDGAGIETARKASASIIVAADISKDRSKVKSAQEALEFLEKHEDEEWSRD